MTAPFANHPPYARWAHIILRIIFGALLMQHGAQKLLGVLGGIDGAGNTVPTFSLLWVAGIIELGGGALVVIGLFTRLAAFIIAGEMAVAYFMVHNPRGFWPILNRGEIVVAFCFVFLYLCATGAGAFSLDYSLARKRTRDTLGT